MRSPIGLSTRVALLGALLLGGAGLALAEDRNCEGYGALSDDPALVLGRVAEGTPRVRFVRNGSEAARCPDATEACLARAFLVPGNRVILGRRLGSFDYFGAKGADRAGWLPAAAVVAEPPSAVSLGDWAGTWTREEAEITLKPGQGGVVAIKGDATYGALDPDRVKRGAVNVGQIEGTVTPSADRLAFDMGDKATLPVDKGDETDCKVWMRRLGPYLLVDDNRQCGGMNVNFGGAYTRKAP